MRLGSFSSLAAAALVSAVAVLATTSTPAPADAAPKAGPSGKRFELPREWTYADDDDARWRTIQSQLGRQAAALNVKNWVGEAPVIKELKGQIVVFDFWATWCGPCIRAIPHTNEIMHSYADKGVKVIGICATSGAEKMNDVVKKHSMRYPTAADIGDQTTRAYGVQWFPYYVIMDRKGIIRAAGLTPDRVDDALDALLEEQPLEGTVPDSEKRKTN